MPKTPTDAEILEYDNVPVPVAAAYLGIGVIPLRSALQQGTAPFGYSVRGEADGSKWIPQISPGLLVGYKNGTLPILTGNLVSALSVEIEKVLELRSRAALSVLGLLDHGKDDEDPRRAASA